MKQYKLTLIPEEKTFDSLFDSKQEATIFVYQYIANYPGTDLTPFDFRLEECETKATDITSYDKAVSILGGVDRTTIAVDKENFKALNALDELMTIARAWNEVDEARLIQLPHPEQMRYFPQFSDDTDDERHYFCYEHPMASEHDFGIEALVSFRTKELAETFSSKFKEVFARLFNIPYES